MKYIWHDHREKNEKTVLYGYNDRYNWHKPIYIALLSVLKQLPDVIYLILSKKDGSWRKSHYY